MHADVPPIGEAHGEQFGAGGGVGPPVESPKFGFPAGGVFGSTPAGRFCIGTTASIGTACVIGQHPHALRWHESPGGGAAVTTVQSALLRHWAGASVLGIATQCEARHAATKSDAGRGCLHFTAEQSGIAQSTAAHRAASFTFRGTAWGSPPQQLPQHPLKVLSTQSASALQLTGGGGGLRSWGPGATSASRLKVTSARSMETVCLHWALPGYEPSS